MAQWNTVFTVRPYGSRVPNGYPVAVRVENDHRTGARVRVVSIEADGSAVCRFEAGPYRPGMHVRDERAIAQDVFSFAAAYAADGEQFDRDPADLEQIHADWWALHGDALSLECEPDDDADPDLAYDVWRDARADRGDR